ncbi:hypothetical protein [Streptomyces fuscichromogenes]|uniref:Uncharacterized protein n=1 Tax=Streptomyces fuscichromogenes TaxID=1324013 RepID=A0A917XQQ3_9ACTN|nr:hypothetical protein [Streptomyces fuscichromogenes]GGN46268.1 hypothetical protein GCM10011578_099020 [Streptomyces fuscichromogenes]
MTTVHITHSRPETFETAETRDTSTRRAQPPAINELVVAALRMEDLAETAGSPDDETAAHINGTTTEQQRSFVLGHAARIRAALDKITAPYETPTPPEPPESGSGADDIPGSQRTKDSSPTDEPTAVAALHQTVALYAILIGDQDEAKRIVSGMLPDERAEFAGHLDDLRRLLGPVCQNCGNVTEIGTATTDPFSEMCRFLCVRCAAAHRTR